MRRLRVLSAVLAPLALPAAAGAALRPDPSFGSGGFATLRIPGTSALAYGAVGMPGGAVVAAGQAITPKGDGQVLVARFRADGRLDRSFGTGGVYRSRFPAAAGPFIATSVARDRP